MAKVGTVARQPSPTAAIPAVVNHTVAGVSARNPWLSTSPAERQAAIRILAAVPLARPAARTASSPTRPSASRRPRSGNYATTRGTSSTESAWLPTPDSSSPPEAELTLKHDTGNILSGATPVPPLLTPDGVRATQQDTGNIVTQTTR